MLISWYSLHTEKVSLQNLKSYFPVILRVFDFDCHGQTSLRVRSLMFRLILMKFGELKSLHQGSEKLDLHKM